MRYNDISENKWNVRTRPKDITLAGYTFSFAEEVYDENEPEELEYLMTGQYAESINIKLNLEEEFLNLWWHDTDMPHPEWYFSFSDEEWDDLMDRMKEEAQQKFPGFSVNIT